MSGSTESLPQLNSGLTRSFNDGIVEMIIVHCDWIAQVNYACPQEHVLCVLTKGNVLRHRTGKQGKEGAEKSEVLGTYSFNAPYTWRSHVLKALYRSII